MGYAQKKERLEEGRKFQDFVQDIMRLVFGININIYSSKQAQYNFGESLQRVEIKLNTYSSKSRGVYALCHKRDNINENWRPAGFLENWDARRHIIIGDYNTFYYFHTDKLKEYYWAANEYDKFSYTGWILKESKDKLSQGIIISHADCTQKSIHKFNAKEKIGENINSFEGWINLRPKLLDIKKQKDIARRDLMGNLKSKHRSGNQIDFDFAQLFLQFKDKL